jgi:hypothetical protein
LAKFLAAPVWVTLVAVLAACTPEADCRSGLQQVRPRVAGAMGTGAHPEAIEQINQASIELALAEELAAAGDFQGCIDKVEAARVLLNKSQRS